MIYMKKILLLALLTSSVTLLFAQQEEPQDDSWKNEYRETATRINNLVHTKLEVKPDFSKSWMYGKAWLTLVPHFYPTDSLTLDAKGMEIQELSIVKGSSRSKLKYTYNGMQLFVNLDRTYKDGEKYTIYISYTAKPNELETKGSAAITSAKGLYFINPTVADKNKLTKFWTQVETEANSV